MTLNNQIYRHYGGCISSYLCVCVAAVVGFVVGFLFSLALPYLSGLVADWQLTLPEESVMSVAADYFAVIAWGVTGATAVIAAINTYDMMTSKPIPLEQ